MNNSNHHKQILNMLEQTRDELVKVGLKYGLNHPKTMEVSNKIDQLHNNYNKIMNKNNKE